MDITSFILGLACGGAVAALAVAWRSQQQLAPLKAELAALDARRTAEAAAQAEKIAALSAVESRLGDTLKGLAQEALAQNNQQFLQLAETKLKEQQASHKTDLTALLSPLKANLDQLSQHNQSMERNRAGAYETLTTQILSLKEETGRLSRALRAPQTRGRWGEMQLQRLIELSGLEPHTDYTLQTSFNTEDGRLRPDCIIRLPGGKQVVIDVKTPLEAYLDAEEARDENEQREALARYARHVKKHVQQLSDKSYYQQLQQAPDYVIMFLPGEHFMSAALREAPDLFDEALQKQVILASTSTLMILLKAYAYSWRQETMVESALKVSEIGRELFGRLQTLTKHFEKLGGSISKTMQHFNEAMGSYETRVLSGARKFQDYGLLDQRMAEAELTVDQIEEVAPRRLAASQESEHSSADVVPLIASKE